MSLKLFLLNYIFPEKCHNFTSYNSSGNRLSPLSRLNLHQNDLLGSHMVTAVPYASYVSTCKHDTMCRSFIFYFCHALANHFSVQKLYKTLFLANACLSKCKECLNYFMFCRSPHLSTNICSNPFFGLYAKLLIQKNKLVHRRYVCISIVCWM